MSWRAITETDLLLKISGPELSGLRRAALAAGQADPVAEAIAQQSSLVRGYIAAASYELDATEGTVPARLIGPACDLIILDIMTRAGGTVIDPEDQRRKNGEAALRLLRDVAAGRFSITDPASGAESAKSGASVIGSRTARVTRANMRGF